MKHRIYAAASLLLASAWAAAAGGQQPLWAEPRQSAPRAQVQRCSGFNCSIRTQTMPQTTPHYRVPHHQPDSGVRIRHRSDSGNTAVDIRIPKRTEVYIHRDVQIQAPPGTTVIYSDGVPVGYPESVYVQPNGDARLLRSNNGLCVDAGEIRPYGGGMSVTAGSCHGRNGQQWVWEQGRLNNGGLCLDAPGGGQAGAAVITYPCNQSHDQQWQWLGGQLRHTASGLCLDSSDHVLRIQPCRGSSTQYFRY